MSDISLCRIDQAIKTAIEAEGKFFDCGAFEAVRHLQRRVEELEKDSQRLEWLVENFYAVDTHVVSGRPVVCAVSVSRSLERPKFANSWREAIDAAREGGE